VDYVVVEADVGKLEGHVKLWAFGPWDKFYLFHWFHILIKVLDGF
jgi:hypothetical protein